MEIKSENLEFNEELKPLENPKNIIIHHTHNPELTLITTHKLHQEKFKWAGVGYNYLIEKDSTIFEARGMYIGAHAKGHNAVAIGIALVGNFDEFLPSSEQLELLIELCTYFMFKYDIEPNKVLGHRELEGVTKSCPGSKFNMDEFRELLKVRISNNNII
ncbi:peptidoglycan recognition protein family protein [Clostridium gasigenes]|uniref:peptidoglycan recognition protein family protein n=1 Tax=Clostridium gasigenes TaxID=94869 RepID=UPI001C0C3E1B|nr:peptidoglycan recognition family protein [Clostridium gasigenes]MBU3130949.1 peptidoglycan recognition protein family protein [Clostridium gasigenes]